MYVDPIRPEPGPRAAERAGKRVVSALQEMVGGIAELLAMEERAWASATFSGARHTVTLRFHGTDDCEAADRFIEALPEHEFALPGQLVADASVSAVDHALAPSPRLTVTCELLLLEDC